MKTKAVDLRNQSISELKHSRSSLLRERFKLRLKKSSGELTKTHPIKDIRRSLARIETILREKEGNQE